jgi:hypothetical protein
LLAPDVCESDKKDSKKNQHFKKRKQPDLFEHDRPGKQKDDFDLEHKKYQCDKVKSQVELNPRSSERDFPALVGAELVGGGIRWAKKPAQSVCEKREKDADTQKEEHGRKMEVHRVLRELIARPNDRRQGGPVSVDAVSIR